MNTALATVVWASENRNPVKAMPRLQPPITAGQPALRNSSNMAPRWRTAMTQNSVNESVTERTSSTCHTVASSTKRNSSPPKLQKPPAAMTSTMPRA